MKKQKLFWIEPTATHNNLSILGLLYANGQGVQQSFTEAEKWCQMATEQGNSEAKDILNELYQPPQ